MTSKILTTVLIASASLIATAQKEVKSTVKAVTVYLDGAEITREGKIYVGQGTSELKLTDLSPYIRPNSVQVKVNNKAVTVMSVRSQVNYWSEEDRKQMPEIKAIDDSIKKLQFKLAVRNTREKAYKEEKSLLLANKNIGGSNTGVDIEDLMDAADFYRERLIDIETKLLDIAESKKAINKEINLLNRRRRHLYNGVKNTGEILVSLTSEIKTNARIEVSYIANRAGWEPFYEIRANSIDEPVELVYKGRVTQNTGEDWNNVKISLSTGNPSVSHTQPKFNKWYVQYYTTRPYRKDRHRAYLAEAPMEALSVETDAEAPTVEGAGKSKSIANFTTVTQNTITTSFDVSIPYTIKSTGKPNLVEVQKYELPVSYQYFAMPRNDKSAFLLAKITEWGNYNLMSGNANIYFENTFVGTSYLETNVANDTLDVSLGRDKSIVVTRERVKDFCKTSTFGGNKKSTRGYELKIRNNKSQPVEIEVVDQIPLSNTKEIEVNLLEKSGAVYNEKTGKLTWRLTIPANSTQSVMFKFEVKYPKDKVVSGL